MFRQETCPSGQRASYVASGELLGRATHPGIKGNAIECFGDRGNTPEVMQNVILGDRACRYLSSFRANEDRPENCLAEERPQALWVGRR